MNGSFYNVLFLCTGNSARSIMAESVLAHPADGRFRAFSAGSRPSGTVHPMALEVLRERNHDVSGLRSKSWDEFAEPGAAKMDFVFTVCGSARAESCPIWPGQPISAHWGVEDPAAFEGSHQQRRDIFLRTYGELEMRIEVFAKLQIEELDRITLKKKLDAIGELGSTSEASPATSF